MVMYGHIFTSYYMVLCNNTPFFSSRSSHFWLENCTSLTNLRVPLQEYEYSCANQLFANVIPNYAGFLPAKTWLHIAGWIF